MKYLFCLLLASCMPPKTSDLLECELLPIDCNSGQCPKVYLDIKTRQIVDKNQCENIEKSY